MSISGGEARMLQRPWNTRNRVLENKEVVHPNFIGRDFDISGARVRARVTETVDFRVKQRYILQPLQLLVEGTKFKD